MTGDTFEKVDAAVVLIELLLTSVSVSFTELKTTENYLSPFASYSWIVYLFFLLTSTGDLVLNNSHLLLCREI